MPEESKPTANEPKSSSQATEEFIKRVAEAPAVAVEKTIDTGKALGDQINRVGFNKAKGYWNTLGPGLTTGAADDDPSGIATYSQTGSTYGYQLSWLALFTFPLMSVVQEMCARIGLVTGRGLAGNIRLHFPKPILYSAALLLFAANSLNIGADLGAMATAAQLIYPNISFGALIIGFTLLSLGLQIFTSYESYAKYLKWLALVLLSYVFSALSINLDWGQILKSTLIPTITFSRDQIILICGILGTTISPYLFFWQTSQEVEEEILTGKTNLQLREGTNDDEIKKMRIDVWSGMFISNLVMFFIIVSCAAALNASGITNITSAADAAAALRPIAGDQAYFLFALGIIGTGMLAVPILAGSASYALSESFGWKHGLYRQLKQAYPFYGVIIISMLVGLAISFAGIDPIKALLYSAVANGLVAPVVLVLILLISGNKKIMKDRANGSITNLLGWIITGAMIMAGAAAIYSLSF